MNELYENNYHQKWEKIVALSKRSANRNQQILLQMSKFEEINVEMAKKTEKLKKERDEALVRSYSRTQPVNNDHQGSSVHYKHQSNYSKNARQLKFQPSSMPYYKDSKMKAYKNQNLAQLPPKSPLHIDLRKPTLEIYPSSARASANIGYREFRNQNASSTFSNQHLIGLQMLKDNQNIKLPSTNLYRDYESFVKKANISSSFAQSKRDIDTQTSTNYSPEKFKDVNFHTFSKEKPLRGSVDKPETTFNKIENLSSINEVEFQVPLTKNKLSCNKDRISTTKSIELNNADEKIVLQPKLQIINPEESFTNAKISETKSKVEVPILTSLRNGINEPVINSSVTKTTSNYPVINSEKTFINSENQIFNSDDSITKSENSSAKLVDSITKVNNSITESAELSSKPEASITIPENSITNLENSNTKLKDSISEPTNKTTLADDTVIKTENSITKPVNSSSKSDNSFTKAEDFITKAEESNAVNAKSGAQNLKLEHVVEKSELSRATAEVAENKQIEKGDKQLLINAKNENLIDNKDVDENFTSQIVIAENKDIETVKDNAIGTVIVENSMKLDLAKSENKQKNTFSFLASSDEEDEDSFFDFLQSTAKTPNTIAAASPDYKAGF